MQLFFAAVNVNASYWWHVNLHSLLHWWGFKRDVLLESDKMPAYHRICVQTDPHSHGACTRLTETFPPALQDLYRKCNDLVCCVPELSPCLLKYRFRVRRDQPHNFWFLIIGLLDELKYAVRTRGNYRDARYATNN